MEIIKSFAPQRSRIKGEKLEQFKYKTLPVYEILAFDEVAWHKNIELEIGSGYGKTIAHLAQLKPEKLFIACEVYTDALSSICNKLNENKISNVKIYTNDARFLVSQIPHNALENVYILFPDPWPKKRHHKRRIITVDFLETLAQKIKFEGKLWITTDDDSYKEHICEVIYNQKSFKWLANSPEDFTKEPSWWVKTKFQEKAEATGNSCVFFELQKCEE